MLIYALLPTIIIHISSFVNIFLLCYKNRRGKKIYIIMKKKIFLKKGKKKLDKGAARWYTKTRRLRGQAETPAPHGIGH